MLVTPEQLLDDYNKLADRQANEAETRLKLIDKIVFDVLGWTHDDVEVEERVSEDKTTQFADYTIRTVSTSLLIEAKRVGVASFDVPKKRRELLGRKMVSGEVGDAIKQARDYARKLSIPFAVVTNGSQWVVFPATRTDAVSFEKSSAIIFPDIESVLNNDFSEFYDLLSRDAVISGSLENDLLGQKEDQIIGRRLNLYFKNSFSKISRSSLFPLIEDEVVTAFSEDLVSSDVDLFSKCYVDTPDRLKFDSRIGMHLTRRDNPAKSSPMKVMTASGKSSFSDAISRASDNVRPLALLVLGQVGAGKTTFINHVRLVRERERFEPRKDAPYPHWIYVDCRKLSRYEDALEFFVSVMFDYIAQDEFLSSYERCVKHAYKSDIDSLLAGPLKIISDDEPLQRVKISEFLSEEYKNKKSYVENILKYAAKNCAVFLVVDNVDQFEDQSVQESIFSDAIAIAQRLNLSLVLAMRDATYVANKARPIFDAFDFDPIQVDAPDVKMVLSRRFNVARELLRGKKSEFVAENGAKIELDDTSIVIDLVSQSVLDTEIGNAISVLSTGDIRLCLRMTREFLRNGYSATGKAMRIFKETGRYRLPPHEAMRAIMLGNQSVYDEKYSPVANPFDANLSMTSAQFLRLFVLSALVNAQSTKNGSSFTGEEIRLVLEHLGFGPEVTLRILRGMCEARYIFTTSHGQASFESSFVPSRLGGYVLRGLIPEMVFLENVMVDTFIDDDNVWNTLYKLTEEIYDERAITHRMTLRKERVEVFYSFLEKRYLGLQEDAARRSLSREWLGNPLAEARPQLERNLERAMGSAERIYGPKQA
ncbi:hypothetical protein UF64_15300 [Thalassospira sp. HJ]|uniref:ATP-binding protein n=1 Tax=Thalassospira sp. HJ TaxID=1616823 RepID=UPI0005CEDE8A|nr:ATP-binding protein [Thalassospira sp. HJ]KJE34434.1 hypothetical protein UF64_15300 [Thalassospira sp. HJ]